MVNLFEDLAVSPRILLSTHSDWLVPAPHILDKSLIFLPTGIKLGEFIALIVWGNVEGRGSFLASDKKSASDYGIVRFPEDRGGAKDVFAGGFKAVKEST